MNARKLILQILSAYDRQPGSFERTVDGMLRGAHLDRRDKGFVFEIVCGIMRRRLTLDYMIDRLLAAAQLRKNGALRRILQIGLYQLVYLDRVPDHAAVNESVNLAKNEPETKKLAGVVNAVLRRVIADHRVVALPGADTDLVERLSIEYSHPGWMVERWLRNFGLTKTKQLLAFNNGKPDTYLRRKIRDIPRLQFESEIRSLCDPAAGYLNLYYRFKKNIVPENIKVFRQGMCTVQAPSSGWVVALMGAEKGEKVLDICSSPGGKTSLLSELVGDSGSVCASDGKWLRIKMCVETVRRMHCRNVYMLVNDGRFPPFSGVFDKVLLDAPCSATGVLHRHPDARWTRIPEDIAELAVVQGSLLESAARCVGPGGTVVYSTCSIEPEENEDQVAFFLKNHPEFIHSGCPEGIPQMYINAAGFLSITPFSHGIDGMFGARLKRV